MKAAMTVLLALMSLSIESRAQEHVSLKEITYVERSMYRDVMVAEGGGYRCIAFGMASPIQSCMLIANPKKLVLDYTKGIFAGFAFQSKPQHILIIGLGGGIIPQTISSWKPDIQIDSVEIDPAVANVAQHYFNYQPSNRSTITIEDARVFVREKIRQKNHYDMIIVDAFDRNYIPEHLLTKEFFSQLKNLLSKQGVVVANTFQNPKLTPSEDRTYQAVFSQLYELRMQTGNRILIASDQPPLNDVTLQDRIQSISQELHDTGMLLSDLNGVRKLPMSNDGVVLTDRFNPANLLMLKD